MNNLYKDQTYYSFIKVLIKNQFVKKECLVDAYFWLKIDMNKNTN